jgi:hypothetical protein
VKDHHHRGTVKDRVESGFPRLLQPFPVHFSPKHGFRDFFSVSFQPFDILFRLFSKFGKNIHRQVGEFFDSILVLKHNSLDGLHVAASWGVTAGVDQGFQVFFWYGFVFEMPVASPVSNELYKRLRIKIGVRVNFGEVVHVHFFMNDSLGFAQGKAMPAEIAVVDIRLGYDYAVLLAETTRAPDDAEFAAVALFLVY